MQTENSHKGRILLVEDEIDIAEPIVDGLTSEKYLVRHAGDGERATQLIRTHAWDLVILDLMLPDMQGEAILSYLSQRADYPAVLVLSARVQTEDKISLFKRGCDDYLTKPFSFGELLVRVQALLRRPPRVRSNGFSYRGLDLNIVANEISANGTSVNLTPKETAMCRVFMEQSEQVISRKELLQHVWGLREEPSANYIGIHLFKLRKKMAEIGREDWLQTVRSSGVVLCDPQVNQYGD